MYEKLSVAHLTAINTPPPQFVYEAAEAGFSAVGLRLTASGPSTPGYPLMEDDALMRQTRDALAATGLTCHDIEFIRITPDLDINGLGPFLDAGATLGASQIITKADDPDHSRLADTLGQFAEAAAEREMRPALEFFPWTDVPDIATALSIAQAAGPTVGLLMDSLHFDRSASTHDALRAVDPSRIGFAHLSDAPVHPPYSEEELMHTGRFERLPLGEGEIDLVSFVKALPDSLVIGLEVPMTALMAEIGSAALLKKICSAAKQVLVDAA